MNSTTCYRLDSVTVVDIVGVDAAKIIHNLTTNEVTRLGSGRGCESFVTDVRGKTLGHVLVFATEDGLRLIGAGGQSTRLVEQSIAIRFGRMPSRMCKTMPPLRWCWHPRRPAQ